MEKNKKTGAAAAFDAISLVSQLGFSIAVPIVLMALLGNWIDKKIGTTPWIFILFLMIGIVAGFVSAYKQIMTVTKKK